MDEAWVVTVRSLTKNPDHDPQNKKAGRCHWSDHCTDVTGEHHSFVFYGTEDNARKFVEGVPGWRITRLERI